MSATLATETDTDNLARFDSPALPIQKDIKVTFCLNGKPIDAWVEPWTSLLDTIREEFGLTGTKKGCDHGQCGACTVLVNGKRINSCLTLAVMKDGAEITTIEGLADGDQLHPMQQAFVDCDALQCGYCTPGQICSAVGLMNEGHAHSRNDVRELMSGNLCRCGAYTNITDAIDKVRNDESHERQLSTEREAAAA